MAVEQLWITTRTHLREEMEDKLQHVSYTLELGGCADKSLARPGRKKATVTKLGIYSTHSPRSSFNFLTRCSSFYKSLKKKIKKVVSPTRSPRQQ